jgi:hypothetical protein
MRQALLASILLVIALPALAFGQSTRLDRLTSSAVTHRIR